MRNSGASRHAHRRSVVAPVTLALLFLGLAALPALPAAAQTKTLEWQRLDTDITVQPNGDLDIAETNVIHFTSGSFTFGYRDIDLSRLDSVDNIRVTDEAGQDMRFERSTDGDILRIKYYFPSASRETRTLILYYTVRGAVRYYDGGDQVYWSGVYAERNGFPVEAAKVMVRLPEGATATIADAYGPQARVTGQGESLVVAEALEPIPSGQAFEVRVQFPHGIVQGQPSAWQASFDRQREFDENVKPTVNLIVLLVSLIVLFGGPALVVLLWYRRGRDPNVGLIADYLNEPPADITPGVAGTLVDERTDLQDMIATLVDLARRGVLVMEEKGSPNLAGLLTGRDWVFSRGEDFGKPLAPHEQKLVNSLGLSGNESISLSAMRNRFYTKIPGINSELYSQLVSGGYYQRRPDQVRGAYAGLATALMVLTFIVGCLSMTVLLDYTDVGLLLPIGFGATTLALFIVSGAMPVRTRKGADAKMRLEAFKRYLQNIEKYTNVKEATDQFEKYLPFAIAFGLDRTWISKFASVNTPAPTWYVPYGGQRYYGRRGPIVPGGVGGPTLSDVGGAAQAPGGLGGMDRGLSQGLSNINTGLTSMFASVASTFVSTPAPPPGSSTGRSRGGGGGGWSGGGSSGGGSSGGGGGGFG